jgi:tyrosine-protein kinase Etk/Wzc
MSTSPKQTEASEIDLGAMLGVLWESRWRLAAIPLSVGVLAVAGSFLLKPKFVGEVRMMPPQQAQSTASALLGSLGGLASLGSGGGAAGALAGLKNPADQWIGILQGRSIADALIERFKLRQRYDVELQQEARDELDDRTVVLASKDGLIQIDVLDEDPAKAAELANAYVEELRKLTKDMAVSEAGQRRIFFEQQLKLARDGMVKADRELQMVGLVEGVIKSVPEASVAVLGDLRGRLAALDVRIGVLRTSLTDNNPEMRAALREQLELRSQLAQMERNDPVKGASGKAEAYINAVRNVKYYETLFEIMARQYELARADEARDGALIQVIDAAVPAERKSTPKRALIGVVSTAIALALTAFVLLVRARRRLLLPA